METDPNRISDLSRQRSGKILRLRISIERSEWADVSQLALEILEIERKIAIAQQKLVSEFEGRLRDAFDGRTVSK